MWKAEPVSLPSSQKALLEQIAKSRVVRNDHRQRAQLILLFDEGLSNRKAASAVGLKPAQAGIWRKRWLENEESLSAIETEESAKSNDLLKGIETVLSDRPRKGTTPTFSAEQIAKILAVACETPQERNLPLSHWTLSSLREEVIRSGIVENISTSRLQVFLKSAGVTTSQS